MRFNQAKTLWITDPWDSLDHERDSTLRLMQECALLGIPAYWSTPSLMRTEAVRQKLKTWFNTFEWNDPKTLVQKELSEFTHVFYRVDPPVDVKYLQPLILLQTCATKKTKLINPPQAIFSISEKLGPPELASLLPQTLVSSHWGTLHTFGSKLTHLQKMATIAKPLNQAQSKGVVKLEWNNDLQIEHAHQTLSQLTQNFTQNVVLQEFLPAIEQVGETRLWFLNSRLIAQVQKLPAAGQYKIDMDQGGTTQKLVTLSPAVKKIIPQISRALKKHGVAMAAVDCIQATNTRAVVTDFNITSPGLLVQLEKLTASNLSAKILKAVLR